MTGGMARWCYSTEPRKHSDWNWKERLRVSESTREEVVYEELGLPVLALLLLLLASALLRHDSPFFRLFKDDLQVLLPLAHLRDCAVPLLGRDLVLTVQDCTSAGGDVRRVDRH